MSVAAVSLYRWIAPAGSTPFGHAVVHSPTKVQSHTPVGGGEGVGPFGGALVA